MNILQRLMNRFVVKNESVSIYCDNQPVVEYVQR